jgi:hypothetical protein
VALDRQGLRRPRRPDIRAAIGRGLCAWWTAALLGSAFAPVHGAPAEPKPPPEHAVSARLEEARQKMEALKFGLPKVIEADAALYLQKVERDRSAARYDTAYNEDQIAELARVTHWNELEHAFNQKLHERQLIYDPLIFVLVVAVISAGLWFSYLQFTIEQRRRIDLVALLRELKNHPEDSVLHSSALAAWNPTQGGGPHTLELGPIKITSSVVGLIVLAMSLAFFYLYLERVYKIQLAGTTQQTAPAATAAEATTASSATPAVSSNATAAAPAASTPASAPKAANPAPGAPSASAAR